MTPALRTWQCRSCGRSNRTVVEVDGTVRCEHCSHSMKIQPSRERGGETAYRPVVPVRKPLSSWTRSAGKDVGQT